MTRRDAFVRTICEDPLDLDLRRVYADWLMESEEHPRLGYFILESIERGWALGFSRTTDNEMLLSDGPRFRDLFGYGFPGEKTIHDVRHGLIEGVHCTQAEWLTNGPAFVLVQPVRRVRLTDKKPQSFAGFADFGWTDSDGFREPVPVSAVGLTLFKLLTSCGIHYRWLVYPTPEAAHADLSAACVKWARKQAGLPELKTLEAVNG